MPVPRGGHSMTLVGDPQDYIMIFGGVTNETVTSSDGYKSLIKVSLFSLL